MKLDTGSNTIPVNSNSTLRAFINKGLHPSVQVADLKKLKLKRIGDALLIEDSTDKSKLEIPNLWKDCANMTECTVKITSMAQPGQAITITPNSVSSINPLSPNTIGNMLDGSSFTYSGISAATLNNSIASTPSAQTITTAKPYSKVTPVAVDAADGPNYWLYGLGAVLGLGAIGAAASGGSSSKSASPATTPPTPNTPARITGSDTATTLEGRTTPITGTLTVSDPDPNQSQFQALSNQVQTYGTFSIDANGQWTYQVNNNNPAVANLANGQKLTETITVSSTDGTAKTITITINGITAQTTAFSENQSTLIPIYAATTSNISNWQLTGEDAALFRVDSSGHIFVRPGVTLDADNPIDAGQNNTFNLTLTGTGTGAPQVIPLSFTLSDVTEIPSWVSNNDTYVNKANGSGLTTLQSGLASLLGNDEDQASWHSLINDVRPVGDGISLSYAFQNIGSLFDPENGGPLMAIDGSYSSQAKTAIRNIFNHIATFSGITFSESTAQSATSGYADIRLFSGSATNIGLEPDEERNVLAYAYQPGTSNPKSDEIAGNVFFNNTSVIAANNPDLFTSLFSNEQQTMTHEIGHALGLDHPFLEGKDAGFSGFFGNPKVPNKFGVRTGGGHDTPNTDMSLETNMTYHDVYRPDGYYSDIKQTPIVPWKAGVYDMAALQHLYGANLEYNKGNTVYNYYSDQPVFDTIWDGGGIDTIVQHGDRDAVIDLRGGAEFSRVGYFTTLKIEIDLNYLGIDYRTAEFTFSDNPTYDSISNDGRGLMTLYVPMPIRDSTFTMGVYPEDIAISPDAEPIELLSYDFSDIREDEKYNLGIGFGVTIENATGGDGHDQLIGNDAPNVLNGGAGNDSMVNSYGADTYIGGSGADNLVIFDAADIAFDIWTDFDIEVDAIFIPSSSGLTTANLEWTQASNTLRISEGSNTYDMVIQTNGAFIIDRDVFFI